MTDIRTAGCRSRPEDWLRRCRRSCRRPPPRPRPPQSARCGLTPTKSKTASVPRLLVRARTVAPRGGVGEHRFMGADLFRQAQLVLADGEGDHLGRRERPQQLDGHVPQVTVADDHSRRTGDQLQQRLLDRLVRSQTRVGQRDRGDRVQIVQRYEAPRVVGQRVLRVHGDDARRARSGRPDAESVACRQEFSLPSAHLTQMPQLQGPYTATASSPRSPLIPEPRAATVPTPSWPRVSGRS